MTTLKDIRDAAERKLLGGDPIGALKSFRLVIEGEPLDFHSRLRIADTLLAMGETRLAGAVYAAVAIYDIKAGVPLRALVAIKMISRVFPEVSGLQHDLAALYSKDSPRVGRGSRAAPVDLSAQVRDDIDVDFEMDEGELKKTTAQMAAYTENIQNFPTKVPPVALFSQLGEGPFERVVDVLELRRLEGGDVVVREGDPGDSFFVVARGMVRVFRETDDGRVDLAHLGEGSILGEMALLSSEPRSASVDVEGSADLLVFNREALAAIASELPQVAPVLERFAQERMIRTVLATNRLFQPFEPPQRRTLLERFEAHKVPGDTVIVRQDEEGLGFYIILSGAVNVTRVDEGGEVHLATLGSGDCFGEISLVHERPTTAKVTTARDSAILFLPREYFQKIIEAMPALAEYYMDLGVQRIIETQEATAAAQEVVVDDDDLIML